MVLLEAMGRIFGAFMALNGSDVMQRGSDRKMVLLRKYWGKFTYLHLRAPYNVRLRHFDIF